MRLFTIFLILNLLLSNVCGAKQEVTLLNEGDKAPFSGILFPKDVAERTRLKLLEADTISKINESLNTSIELYRENSKIDAEKFKIASEQVLNITRAYNDEKSLNNWERIGWFGLGILAVWAASRAIR